MNHFSTCGEVVNMKATEIVLMALGIGAFGIATYTLVSRRSEDVKKAISNASAFIPTFAQRFEKIESIKEIPQAMETKVSEISKAVESKISEIPKSVGEKISKLTDTATKPIQESTKKVSESIVDASKKLKEASQNINQAVANIAEIPKKVVERVQPVVVPAVVGATIGGGIGAVVSPVFYRAGWEIGKATQNFGHWLIEKTGGMQSPIVKASQLITSIFGRW